MLFVIHADAEPAALEIDGRRFHIPPNEPFEVPEIRSTDCNNNGPYEYLIPDHLVAQKLIEHGWYHGIVDVPVIREKGNLRWDTESALGHARHALREAEDRMLAQYVTDQQERIKEGKSALPPSGRIAVIVERRAIDLKRDFNIDPPGWTVGKITDRDAEIAALKAQNEIMLGQMAEMMARFAPKDEPEPEENAKRKR